MSGHKKPGLTLEEQEKAKALHASGVTFNAIGKELNRSPHTIKKYLTEPGVQEEIVKIKGELSDMFEGLAKRMITSITEEDIKKISSYQRTIAASAATDKMRLLRDQSTLNIANGMSAILLSVHNRLKTEKKEIEDGETMDAEFKEIPEGRQNEVQKR